MTTPNSREAFLAKMQAERDDRHNREKTRAFMFRMIIASIVSLTILAAVTYPLLKDTSFHILFALMIGSIGSFGVAIALFGVTFHSARHGHDELPNYRELYEKQLAEKVPLDDLKSG